MKHLIVFLVSVISFLALAQEPNDCVNYIQACGNQDISLDVSGIGNVQEIGTNVCQGQENNSLWLRVTISQTGTLGFTLTPLSTSILEDYDFWVFGPTDTCTNLGTAIRCSTTNPNQISQGNNLTGMNGTETETSEGPGPLGNSFVRWLDVLPGESYFIVIDRPEGNAPFNLTWTGSANIINPFDLINLPFVPFENLSLCDFDGNNTESFDFSALTDGYINGNTGFSVHYYNNVTDAVTNQNEIVGSQTVTNQTYYVKVLHDDTSCFEIEEFEVEFNPIEIDEIAKINLCDEDNSGFESFNLNTLNLNIIPAGSYNLTYYSTLIEAENGTNPVNSTINAQLGLQSYFVRAVNPVNNCYAVQEIEIEVFPPILTENPSFDFCDTDNDNSLIIDLTTYETDLATTNNYSQVQYFETLIEAENNQNAITNSTNYEIQNGVNNIYVRFDNDNCHAIAELTLNLYESIFTVNQAFDFCDTDNDNSFELDLTTYETALTSTNNYNLVQYFFTLNEAEKQSKMQFSILLLSLFKTE